MRVIPYHLHGEDEEEWIRSLNQKKIDEISHSQKSCALLIHTSIHTYHTKTQETILVLGHNHDSGS